ncbi:hypothetical protein [Erythrobacter sp. YT30]|uniref:hypothetical protein n=1 Tax=Erythrobacter sp. YT30 TaxID=1735012 RepID=UPI000AB8BABD|nr:hypothetical protein [Erythrobacter sp. YT30]
MGLFGPKLPIEKDEFEWLMACFAWLDREIGQRSGPDGFRPHLILPDDPELMAATTAPQMFDVVKRAAGLEQWHCQLEKGEARRELVNTGLDTGPFSQNSALGTFSVEGNTPIIRYDPELLHKPDALVATFAHELSHLLIHSLGMPPGGHELEEHATDCTAVYLGFGVFLANSARNFSQFTDGAMQGWQSDTSGYLSENALVTAVAIFEKRFSAPAGAEHHLKPYLKSVHRKAHRYLAKKHTDLASELSEMELSAWA